jgi:hypothetical protein
MRLLIAVFGASLNLFYLSYSNSKGLTLSEVDSSLNRVFWLYRFNYLEDLTLLPSTREFRMLVACVAYAAV